MGNVTRLWYSLVDLNGTPYYAKFEFDRNCKIEKVLKCMEGAQGRGSGAGILIKGPLVTSHDSQDEHEVQRRIIKHLNLTLFQQFAGRLGGKIFSRSNLDNRH